MAGVLFLSYSSAGLVLAVPVVGTFIFSRCNKLVVCLSPINFRCAGSVTSRVPSALLLFVVRVS